MDFIALICTLLAFCGVIHANIALALWIVYYIVDIIIEIRHRG